MNALDGIVVLVGVGAAVGGYRLGFVARALSWIGLAIGVTLATLLLPRIIQSFRGADELRLFLSAVGILVGSAALGQALGLLAGSRLRFAIPPGPAEVADRAAGSIVGALGVIVALWFLLPSMADVQGWPASQARTSAVAQAIDDAFPDAPDSFQVLRQLIDQDQFPRVFDTLEPSPSLGSPPVSAELAPDVSTRVAESAVQIRGEACGVIQEGSGFVAAPSVVLTNAHVVAGGDSQ